MMNNILNVRNLLHRILEGKATFDNYKCVRMHDTLDIIYDTLLRGDYSEESFKKGKLKR